MSKHPNIAALPKGFSGCVAPLLPPTAPVPEPAKRVNFFKALFFFWLFPKQLGPHLAVGSLWRALLAHVLALFLATGIVGIQTLHEWVLRESFTLHMVRVGLADAVLEQAAMSASVSWNWVPALGAFAAVPLLEIALLLLATVSMPWCAGGDRASSVWKRSVKNVYWSTTFVVPVAVVVVFLKYLDLNPRGRFEIILLLGFLGMFSLLVMSAVRMLVSGAHRYVGEPDGPAFAPREPTCDQCGYAIVHLPMENRCPECGLPVRESLPGGRRSPTRWQEHEFRLKGFAELLRLQLVIVRQPDFFQRIPVHAGMASARHFWWGTFLVMMFVILAVPVFVSVVALMAEGGDASGIHALIAIPCVLLLCVMQALIMFPVCLWAQLGCGLRDYRVSAIVCYYATPLMWPLIFVVLTTVIVFYVGGQQGSFLFDLDGPSDTQLWFWGVIVAVCVASIVLALMFWLRRLVGAIHAVRYANA
ncbi:MAG: hypothetical protein KAV82_01790 [Phycisphaerae bacterium]|nr:hypothetical protein [Phycisphaerae bacterium]